MNFSKSRLAAAAFALGMSSALPVAWAESQVGDPGAFGITVDPNADGTKLYGPVTLAYDYEIGTPRANLCFGTKHFVRNLYVVASLTKGNVTQPFNTNYAAYAAANGGQDLSDCFENQDKQLELLRFFITNVIIPQFFQCAPSACPGYAIKSIKNFLTTGVGAGYMDVVLAVK